MIKRNIFLLLFLLFSTQLFSEDKIKVGVIAGFTGDWADYGIAYKDGIELSDVGSNIEFIYEDDQFDPKKSITAFNKLLQAHKSLAAIFVGDTQTASALAKLAKQKEIPLFVWADELRAFHNNKFIYRLWTKNKSDFLYLEKKLFRIKNSKIYIFSSPHPYTMAWGVAVHKFFKKNSKLEELNTEFSDFRPLILKAKHNKAENIGLCLNSGENGLFLKQMKELQVNIPVFTCNFVESSADLDVGRFAMEGIWFTGPDINSEFREKYIKNTGSSDHIISAATFHDAAIILNAALKIKTKETLSEKISKLDKLNTAIKNFKFKKDENDQYFDFLYTTYKIQNGEIVNLGGEAY